MTAAVGPSPSSRRQTYLAVIELTRAQCLAIAIPAATSGRDSGGAVVRHGAQHAMIAVAARGDILQLRVIPPGDEPLAVTSQLRPSGRQIRTAACRRSCPQ
jgi:hypothetical protein